MSHFHRYAILADDLTGAGDVGVQFSRAGLRTRTLCDARLPMWPAGIDTVVVDTASRGLSPAAAYAAVAEAAQVLDAAGARLVYKKIDSTLRGALGAELDAVLDVCGAVMAVVCPAYPANGRTLVDGILAVDGLPVAQTQIGRDPIAPVRESHLPTLLAQQSRRRVVHLAQVDTAVALEAQLRGAMRDGAGIVVCDARDEAGLAAIVEGVDRLAMHVLLAGAAGLARPLAAQLAECLVRRVLVVCGSQHPVAQAQVAALGEHAARWGLDAEAAMTGGTAWRSWIEEMCRGIEAASPTQPAIVILAPPDSRTGVRRSQVRHAQIDAATVAGRLAEAATAALATAAFAGLVVTGGDTLHSLLTAWEASGIDLVAEIAPGIPIGTVAGGVCAGLPLISKAGGFGGPDAVVCAVQILLQQPISAIGNGGSK